VVGVSGPLMRTRTGEVTVRVSSVEMLAKSLRPLPYGKEEVIDGQTVRHSGFADPEQRYRQRYADLAVHSEVRALFVARSRLITTTVNGIDIVNVYIPNGQAVGSEKFGFKLAWMQRLREFFDANYDPKTPVLLCGDFNVAPEDRDVHDVRLWQGRIMFSEQEHAALQHIKDWGFTDAYRLHQEAGGHFTWWDYRAGAFRRNLGLRIDHVWISESLVSRSVRTWIDKDPRTWEKPSDHAPVIAEFE